MKDKAIQLVKTLFELLALLIEKYIIDKYIKSMLVKNKNNNKN